MSNDIQSFKEILYSNTSLEDFLISMLKGRMENLMKAELTGFHKKVDIHNQLARKIQQISSKTNKNKGFIAK